jgi:hypothetical protein
VEPVWLRKSVRAPPVHKISGDILYFLCCKNHAQATVDLLTLVSVLGPSAPPVHKIPGDILYFLCCKNHAQATVDPLTLVSVLGPSWQENERVE